MAKLTDLKFLSAGFRTLNDPATGRRDMVLRLTSEAGRGYTVVIDEDDAMRLIEQVAQTINNRRAIERAKAEREANQR